MTMIYVTHDQTEAMTMADEVALMREGQVEQLGSPADLYERPSTAFTARFIGAPAMNVISVRALTGAAAIVPRHALIEDHVGIRPEHVVIGIDSGLPMRVTAVEYLGAETIVTGTIAGSEVIVSRIAGRYDGAIGDTTGVTWHTSNACVFDGASGTRREETK